jgi:hypothetical protein
MDSNENLLPLTLLLDRAIRSMYDGDEATEDDAMNPIDENDCCNQADGGMTLDEYGVEEFLEEQDDNEDQAQQNILLSLIMHALHEEEEAQQHGHKLRKKIERMRALRRPKTTRKKAAELKFFTDPITGNCCPMTPKLSSWWIWYIQDPKPESIQGAKMFRSRFRLPYASFVQLLQMLRERGGGLFKRWTAPPSEGPHFGDDAAIRNTTTSSRVASPLPLLLLGSLRYLGRGWTFDDLEESTYIHKEVHRVFFHQFIEFGASHLYPIYVKMPDSIQELKECEMAYKMAGFPGCIGSTDATHIPLERVAYVDRQNHLGFKSSTTTRTYNLTVNHKRQILHSTTGHPGRWNDKTLVRFDHYMDGGALLTA